jgi:hypothetical protein
MRIANEIYEMSKEFPVLLKILEENNFEQLICDVNIIRTSSDDNPQLIESVMEAASKCALILYRSAKERNIDWEAEIIGDFLLSDDMIKKYIDKKTLAEKEAALYNALGMLLKDLLDNLKPMLFLTELSMKIKKHNP